MGRAGGLLSAQYYDIDYNAISQSLVLTAFHSVTQPAPRWSVQFRKPPRSATLEVGVLSPQPATEPESLSLGGFLTKLGSDTKPSTETFSLVYADY